MSARSRTGNPQKLRFEAQVRELSPRQRFALLRVIASVSARQAAQHVLIFVLDHLPKDPAQPRHSDAS